MHRVSVHLQKKEPIGAIGGPWWFVQMWLHLYLHRLVIPDLWGLRFQALPPTDAKKEESRYYFILW